jgi:molecular chaperone DnaJ
MANIDYYAVLGVARDATDDQIKKAYRKLVFEFHPDRNPGDKTAEARIREINAAYEVVGDPEARRSYERLRFGPEDVATEAPPDPAVILEAMEQKLHQEGQREIFALLIKDVPRIKAELALVRERTVAVQGYDTFKEPIVLDRAAEVLDGLVTAEMESRRKRLLEVALQMMASQGVVRKGDPGAVKELLDRFERTFRRGRLSGFRNALELFYTRR